MTQYIKVGRNQEPEYWSRAVVSPTASNLFWNLGNVGLGQGVPVNKLVVDGNVSVGTTPYSTLPAPVDGMIIKGNVGIGTTDPTMKLDVWGNTNIKGDITISGELTVPIINAEVSKDGITGLSANQVVYGTLQQDPNFTYVPATGLNITGTTTTTTLNATDVVISNNLTVNGTQTIINVETQLTDQLIIENAGTGPALDVLQTGTNDVAVFKTESQTVLAITDNNCVGVLKTNPQYPLDVNGNIRATYIVCDSPYVFSVRGDASSSLASKAIVPLNTIIYDPRGMFNTSTYIFTAPIKGIYQINYNMSASNSVNTIYYIELSIAGTTQGYTRCVNNIVAPPTANSTASASFVIQLNATDEVKVIWNASPTPITFVGTTSSFSGALLYAIP